MALGPLQKESLQYITCCAIVGPTYLSASRLLRQWIPDLQIALDLGAEKGK